MLEPLIEQMRAERLIEVRGTTGPGSARLSLCADRSRPRPRAGSISTPTHYVGPAPVPLATYVREMKAIAGGARLRRAASGCAAGSRT